MSYSHEKKCDAVKKKSRNSVMTIKYEFNFLISAGFGAFWSFNLGRANFFFTGLNNTHQKSPKLIMGLF